MKDSVLVNKIRRASKIARDHRNIIEEIDHELEKRYGFYPAQLDCDELIDVVQYGASIEMSIEDIDVAMRDAIKINTCLDGTVKTN